jgi:hypothetical protein
MTILGWQIARTDLAPVTISNGANNVVAQSPASYVATVGGWVKSLGVVVPAQGGPGNYSFLLGIYLVDAAGNPTTLLGRTNPVSISRFTTGAIEANLQAPVPLPPNTPFAIAIRPTSGWPAFNVYQADASLSLMHARSDPSGYFATPFNQQGTFSGPTLAIYANLTANVVPAATGLSPAPGATINAAVPTFAATMTDADIATNGDFLGSYQIEVRQVGQTAVIWGGAAATFYPTAGATSYSQLYGGTTLTPAVGYEWRTRLADRLGVFSPWTSWQSFTVSATGVVTLTAPTTKFDDPTSIGPWTGNWSHPAAAGANQLQARVTLPNGVVVKQGPLVTVSIAGTASTPGTAWSLTAAQAGIGTLPPGSYLAQVRGRDSVSNIYSFWSNPIAFRVNAPATTPSNLQPPGGATTTSLPLLEWNAGDPDVDDVPGVDVTWNVKINRPDGTSVTRTTNVYDATRGVASYQTTTADLTQFGTYTWQAQGADTSAGSFGLSPWSALQRLDYLAGPVITITNPTNGDIEATALPLVSWTNTNGTQISYEVKLYGNDAPLPFKSSGRVTSGLQSFQVPQGWLTNGGVYDVTVDLWTATTHGVSLRNRFTVSYTPPVAPTGLAVSTVQPDGDPEPNAALLTWDTTIYPPGEFGGYIIRRRRVADDDRAAVILPAITAPNQVNFVDYLAPANVPLVYELSQYRRSGGPAEESPRISAIITIPLVYPMLVSARTPADLRTPLRAIGADFGGGFSQPEASYLTWSGGGKPTVIATPPSYGSSTLSLTLVVRGDREATMLDRFDRLWSVLTSGHELLFRGQHERMFARVTNRSWKRRDAPGSRQISFDLQEISYQEGQTPAV